MSKRLKIGDVVEFRKIEGPVMVVNRAAEGAKDEMEALYADGIGTVRTVWALPKLFKRVKK